MLSCLQYQHVFTNRNKLLPKNAEFTHMHEWQWVPSLQESAVQKHKTASHRGYYREGLHSQDDFTGAGGRGTALSGGGEPGRNRVLY